nr:hypothetical protein [Tanacetum cinerariifolium]
MSILHIIISSDMEDEFTGSSTTIPVPILPDYTTTSNIETKSFEEEPHENEHDLKDEKDSLGEEEPLPAQPTPTPPT